MTSIESRQRALIDEFSLFDDWMDRYQYLIELGQKLPSLADNLRTQKNIIKGCQSQVWLHMYMQADRMRILGLSDAAIVSGLIAMIIRVYDNQTPAAILQSTPFFLDELGFRDHLSPTRSNGLYSMLQAIHLRAKEFAHADVTDPIADDGC